jgi:hypothetical protein
MILLMPNKIEETKKELIFQLLFCCIMVSNIYFLFYAFINEFKGNSVPSHYFEQI